MIYTTIGIVCCILSFVFWVAGALCFVAASKEYKKQEKKNDIYTISDYNIEVEESEEGD